MKMQNATAVVALLAIFLGSTGPAFADPCGMVPPPPPLEIAVSSTIERIGVQKTFVAFDKGIETMVLRPGFQGNVEEFGMLIPFPSPPTLRKVDDNIFSHIAAAIDPPEVIARVQRFFPRRRSSRSRGLRGAAKSAPAAEREMPLQFDEVRVVKQEAVGMYEVAVLAAGSPEALKRWMDDNSFRYPEGMDDVVTDYVRSKWYFVAVKTKVGQKAGVNPRPGMRVANSRRPAGSTFKGFVQAMGFRFRSKDLVVPMRLSVFNAAGNSRNIVYALTRGPTKIKGIPEDFVKRQVKGRRLYRNLTNPLPLRVIGGTKADLNSFQLQSLPARRDPSPHSGLARELFGSDMLAVRRNRLSSPLEDKEKALLNIGESLGLRGRVIDDLNRAQVKKEREVLSNKALGRLRSMTMTVIDGAFDRELLAKQNLRFQRHRMAAAKNTKANYDAIRQGPAGSLGGKLYRWQVSVNEPAREGAEQAAYATAVVDTGGNGTGGRGTLPLTLFLLVMALGVGVARKRSLRPAALAATLLLVSASLASAQDPRLSRQLAAKGGEAIANELVRTGDAALPQLLSVAVDSKHPVAQGRAIVAMAQVGSPKADAGLAQIVANTRQTMLARTWAAAARMQLATTRSEVFALESLSRTFPATRRPWVKRLSATLQRASADVMLSTLTRVPELRADLQSALRALPAKDLLAAMMHSKQQAVRQRAASYLGTKGAGIGKLVARAVRFDKRATQAPWHGGPLYLPSLPWSEKDARRTADHLLRWMLWAEKKGDAQASRIAANNLMSPALAKAAGYKPMRGQLGYTTEYWLGAWTKTFGAEKVSRLMKDVE